MDNANVCAHFLITLAIADLFGCTLVIEGLWTNLDEKNISRHDVVASGGWWDLVGRLRFSRLEHEPRIYAAAPSGVSVTRIRAFDIDDPSVTPFYRLLGDSVPEGDAQYFQIHSESGNLTTKR
ncbi:hypothetical protein J6590_041122 [Homalodisca vitripennis]|nr:hypothetical protein J6590_041122 [Homalodisca vitripennis]